MALELGGCGRSPQREKRRKVKVRAKAARRKEEQKKPNDTALVSHLQAVRIRKLSEQQAILNSALTVPIEDAVATPVLNHLRSTVKQGRKVLCDYLLSQQLKGNTLLKGKESHALPIMAPPPAPREESSAPRRILQRGGSATALVPMQNKTVADELTEHLLQELVNVKSENMTLLSTLLKKESWAVEMRGMTASIESEAHSRLKQLEAIAEEERDKFTTLRIAYEDQISHNKKLSRELLKIKKDNGGQQRLNTFYQQSIAAVSPGQGESPTLQDSFPPLPGSEHLELRSQILSHTYHALDETKSVLESYKKQIEDLRSQNRVLVQRIAKSDDKLASTKLLLRARQRHAEAEERMLDEDASGLNCPPPDNIPVTSVELLRYTPRPQYPPSLRDRHGIHTRHKPTSTIFSEVISKLEGKALEVVHLEDRLQMMSTVSNIADEFKKGRNKLPVSSGSISTFGPLEAPVGFLSTPFKSIRNKCWTRGAAFSYCTNCIEAVSDVHERMEGGLLRVVTQVARAALVAGAVVASISHIEVLRLRKKSKKRTYAPKPPLADAPDVKEPKARWQRIMEMVRPNYTLTMLHGGVDVEAKEDIEAEAEDDTQSQASTHASQVTAPHEDFYKIEVLDGVFSRCMSRWLQENLCDNEEARAVLAYNLYHHAHLYMRHDPMCNLFINLTTQSLPIFVYTDIRNVLSSVKQEMARYSEDPSRTTYEEALNAISALFGNKSASALVQAQCAMRTDYGASVPREYDYADALDLTEKLSEFGRHCAQYVIMQHREIYLGMETVLRSLQQTDISLQALKALYEQHFAPHLPFDISAYLQDLQALHELNEGGISLPALLATLRFIPLTITDDLRV